MTDKYEDNEILNRYDGSSLDYQCCKCTTLPSTGFGLDARYNHGLSNINKIDAVKSFNRGVQLGVFYIFGHQTGVQFL
jgi:hypothetical protein